MGVDMAMHEDLADGQGRPCTSSDHDNNKDKDCATIPNDNNQLERVGVEDMATRDSLVVGHGRTCPPGEHDNNNNYVKTPNKDNYLDDAVRMMTTIDPIVCAQQSTNDRRKQMKRRWHSVAAMGSDTHLRQR
jgi:hypothetical protein